MPRDYKAEYANYHASPKQKKNRAARNRARRKAVAGGRAAKGDGKDVHHVKPLAKGGARDGPTRVIAAAKNRSFKRNKKAGMA